MWRRAPTDIDWTLSTASGETILLWTVTVTLFSSLVEKNKNESAWIQFRQKYQLGFGSTPCCCVLLLPTHLFLHTLLGAQRQFSSLANHTMINDEGLSRSVANPALSTKRRWLPRMGPTGKRECKGHKLSAVSRQKNIFLRLLTFKMTFLFQSLLSCSHRGGAPKFY